MHCHKDQMEFQEWVNNFKQSTEQELYSVFYVNGNVVVESNNNLNTILSFSANLENFFDSFINDFLYNEIDSNIFYDGYGYDLYSRTLDEDIVREIFGDM